VTGLRFSPDGRAVLTIAGHRVVRLWDREGGRLRHTWKQAGDVRGIDFGPEGREILIGTADGGVGFWDTATGERRGPILRHPKGLIGAGYSADGLTVWAATPDDTVLRWERATGKLLATWPTAASAVTAAFPPGGRVALIHQGGRYVQLCDLASPARSASEGNKLQGRLLAHPVGTIQGLSFSADGSLAASVGSDQTVRLWDTTTAKQVGPALPHALRFPYVALRPDSRVLVLSGDNSLRLWAVPWPVDGSPREVRLWVEQITGLKMDDQGTAHELSAAEVAQRRRRLEEPGARATAGP
jgi:WD40 repeat protein